MYRRTFLKAKVGSLLISPFVQNVQAQNQATNSGEGLLEEIVKNIRVSQWNLDIPRKPFEDYLKTQDDVSITVELIDSDSLIKKNALGFGVMKYHGNFEHDGTQYWRFRGRPKNIDMPSLVMIVEKDGKHLASRAIPIDFKYFTCDGSESHYSNIYSEVNLTPAQFRGLHQLHSAYDHFILRPTNVYIVDNKFAKESKTDRGAVYAPEKNSVGVTSDLFTSPFFEDEGLLITGHEQGHAIIHTLQTGSSGRELVEIIRAYEEWNTGASKEPPNPEIENPDAQLYLTPQVQIFDESSYNNLERQLGKNEYLDYGHPHHNYNEFFASAITIFRHRSKEFIERCNGLKPHQQGQIKEAAAAILKVVDSLAYQKSYATDLIPDFDRLATFFQVKLRERR